MLPNAYIMQLQTFQPARCLTPLIERYWHLKTLDSGQKWNQPWFPLVTHSLIFNFNKNVSVVSPKEGIKRLPECYFIGSVTGPGYCIVDGAFHAFGVDFKPAAIYQLFQVALYQFVDCAINFSEVESTTMAKEVQEKMMLAKEPDKCIDIIEPYLIKKYLQFKPTRKIELFNPALQLILNNNGNLQVKDILKQTFYTKKTFERHFYEFVGLMPKTFHSIVRFNAAIRHLNQSKTTPLGCSIYDLGYYDQSHFVHDFKKFSGRTPKEAFSNASEFDKQFFGL